MTGGVDHAAALATWRSAGPIGGPPPGPLPDGLLEEHHPDRRRRGWPVLVVGPNAGERFPPELARVLQANSPVDDADIAGTLETAADVLVLGAGGAGCIAALVAAEHAEVVLASKLRVGDGNTVMAEGGIQAAVGADDSLQRHYADTVRGGHLAGDRELVAALVTDGPAAIRWLIDQGMTFDLLDGQFRRRRAGGTTAPRVLSFGDATGLELVRVLREAVLLHPRITVLERHPAIELLGDDHGRCAGAVLHDLERRRLLLARAAAVVLATGGAGQLRLGGFPTSNHYGATADGLVLAYRLGARMVDAESFQYHPTGLAWPERVAGQLVSEAVRSEGAILVNGRAERFVDELAPRDVVTAAILRECREGRGIVRDGRVGVFLDVTGVEAAHPGFVGRELRTLARLGAGIGLDPTVEPVLVAPTLHYQNGGVRIDATGAATVDGLWCAGELSGGIHGRNRLMGNALLEVCVFGRRAGEHAALAARRPPASRVGIDHLHEWRRALTRHGLALDVVAPLLFPEAIGAVP